MDNIKKIFNLSDDNSLDELKNSFKTKLIELHNCNLSDIDKQLLFEQYESKYRIGKKLINDKNINKYKISTQINENNYENSKINQYHNYPTNLIYKNPFLNFTNLLNKIEKDFNSEYHESNNTNSNSNNKFYGYYNSHQSIMNPDGTKIVIEKKKKSINGKNEIIKNYYKKMPDGKIIPLTDKEVKTLL